MLVEINLLPPKQKRNITNILILVICGVLLIGVFYFMYLQLQKVQEEKVTLEQEIQETKLLSAQLQRQVTEEMRSDYDELIRTVYVLENYYIPASHVLEHVVKVLPDRGYFYKYNYKNNGEIEMQAIFDVLEDVANFSHALQFTEFVNKVQINTIDTISNKNPRSIDTSIPKHDHIPELVLRDYREYLGEDFIYGIYVPRYIVYFTLELDLDVLKKMRDDETW